MCVKALMSLFVLASKDGWINIMYTGLDAVGVDQQVRHRCTDVKSSRPKWIRNFVLGLETSKLRPRFRPRFWP